MRSNVSLREITRHAYACWDPEDETIGEFTGNPVFEQDGGWWFYDEAYDMHGPFDSARKGWNEYGKYIQWLNTGEYK